MVGFAEGVEEEGCRDQDVEVGDLLEGKWHGGRGKLFIGSRLWICDYISLNMILKGYNQLTHGYNIEMRRN